MNYTYYLALIDEAKTAIDEDYFIAENGGGRFSVDTLQIIYRVSQQDFKGLVEMTSMNLTTFAKKFNLPYRTAQSWIYQDRKCPDYVLELLGLTLITERIFIMEKKFKIISNELYAVRNAGFELDFENDTRHFDFSEWHLKDSEKDVINALDGFYDLDNAFLCKDENGILYAVEYIYTSVFEKAIPMIWQKVKKI